MIYGIQVSVESLFQQSFPYIPQWYRFVSTSWGKNVRASSKLHIIDWIGMTSESLPHFLLWNVEQFASWIHWAGNHEITSVVERHCSHRVYVGVESCNTWCFEEVPYLDGGISRTSCKMTPFWMKIEVGHPILVPFSWHYQLSVR